MKRWSVLTVIAALALSTAFATAQETDKKKEKKDPLEAAKCPVSGKKINPEAFVAYKEGKVYFCCENCPKAFEKDTKKFSAKANHQLVQTRQTARQEKCPLTGRPVNEETRIRVQGAPVMFCCEKCQAKAEAAKGDEQILLIFADENFDKAFKVREQKKKNKKNAAAN